MSTLSYIQSDRILRDTVLAVGGTRADFDYIWKAIQVAYSDNNLYDLLELLKQYGIPTYETSTFSPRTVIQEHLQNWDEKFSGAWEAYKGTIIGYLFKNRWELSIDYDRDPRED